MKIAKLKREGPRIDTGFSSSLRIKLFGRNNLYPQELRDIVFASPAGRCCFERKAMYIEGNGVSSEELAEAVCNPSGDMVDDITHLISRDLALFDGFALHVNYNVLGEITSIHHVPFENCRLEEDDYTGNVAHIALHPDWSGARITRDGRPVRVNKQTVRKFPVFNPNPKIVQMQILRAGGIDAYNGQILYVSTVGRDRYFEPMSDSTLTDMSADEGVSNVSYRNVRNSFMPAAIIWTRKSAVYTQEVEGERAEDRTKQDKADEEFFDAVETLQGDMNACKILTCSGESEEEKPEVINIPMANYDKQFESTRQAEQENIYASFGQEQFYRLRSGSLGFSGEIANSAKREYCEQVTSYQRLVKRYYRQIFEHWCKRDPIPYTGTDDVEIEPLIKSVDDSQTAQPQTQTQVQQDPNQQQNQNQGQNNLQPVQPVQQNQNQGQNQNQQPTGDDNADKDDDTDSKKKNRNKK